MRVIHVPYAFYPDPVGGTEVYVEALGQAQRVSGTDVLIAAPAERESRYDCGGLPVWRFPVSSTLTDLRELYGEGDAAAADAFAHILDDTRPDVVHLHALTRSVSIQLVRVAHKRGIPVVFSYHTPTVSCQRGTLLQWGTEVCDGTLDVARCSQCAAHGLGANRTISRLIGSLPQSIGRRAGSWGLSGGIWTALRMADLVALQHATFRTLMTEVDHVVALCHWVRDVLVRNGVPENKLTVSRQGLCHVEGDAEVLPTGVERRNGRTRMIFLGRLDPVKGIHILIDALRAAPELALDLNIYGLAQGEAGATYLRTLRQRAQGDTRISFQDAVPAREVVSRIREYDIVAVPSQWLETGPMVVLEAFAAGRPVMGSNLGGIAELVHDGADGMLVEAGSIEAWTKAFREVSGNAALLDRLRSHIRAPRKIAESAQDMLLLYGNIADVRQYV